MHTAARTLMAFGLLSTIAARLPAAGAKDYAGAWEMEIVNSGTTFRACSLKLAEGSGGRLEGEMVWRWGSVMGLKGEEQVSLGKDGELLIKNGEWASPLMLRRVGDALEGSVLQKDGKTFVVFATMGEERQDLSGSWDMSVATDEGTKHGLLKVAEEPDGSLRAEAINDEGNNIELKDVTFSKGRLCFSMVRESSADAGSSPRFEGDVRGDRIKGKLTGFGDSPELAIEGTRKRRWGVPVKLLAPSGLDGWKPREHHSSKFGWKCEDGVLTNSEHGDIDIVSTRTFEDFQLHLEFKLVKGGNSGVYLRGRYEVQIQDDFGKPLESHGIGSIYSRAVPLVNAAKPADEWQSFDITLVGRWLTVKLNGQAVIDNAHLDGITGGALKPHESIAGPLMLQGDHGKIWFRNVVVTPAAGG